MTTADDSIKYGPHTVESTAGDFTFQGTLTVNAELDRLRAENATLRQERDTFYNKQMVLVAAIEAKGGWRERLVKAEAALATARKDAKRYRWLRDVGDNTWTPLIERARHGFPHVPVHELGPMVDEMINGAIDRALAQKEEE